MLFDTQQIRKIAPYRHTARYLMETEVHVYAFSMAANVLLSFFPFLTVMKAVCRHLLRWPAAEQAINLVLMDMFPGETGDFLIRNLDAHMDSRFQIIPILLLLFTANGVFEPLEVALNRAWHIATNRSFLRNQIISLGLIFLVGGLALTSMMLTAFNLQFWGAGGAKLANWMNMAVFKMAALPIMIVALFLIYWLLPNGKVPAVKLVPAAVLVGVSLEILKYINFLIWPYMFAKLHREYDVFVHSVTIILWSFLASLVVLAGADWAARDSRKPEA